MWYNDLAIFAPFSRTLPGLGDVVGSTEKAPRAMSRHAIAVGVKFGSAQNSDLLVELAPGIG